MLARHDIIADKISQTISHTGKIGGMKCTPARERETEKRKMKTGRNGGAEILQMGPSPSSHEPHEMHTEFHESAEVTRWKPKPGGQWR